MPDYSNTRIQVRRGSSAEWASANTILASGEPGYDHGSGVLKIGNGSTAWNALASISSDAGGSSTFLSLGDTPANFTSAASKFVRVNSAANALELVADSGIAAFASGLSIGATINVDLLETSSGVLNTSVGLVETSVGLLETSSGVLNTSVGLVETSVGLLETSSGVLNTSVGLVETSVGLLETSSGVLNTSVGLLEAASGALNTSVGLKLANTIEDLTPQLGGNLDMNSKDLTGTGDIILTGSGMFAYPDGECGLVVTDTLGSGLHIGDCAFSNGEKYAGMKHSHHFTAHDYMILSSGTDTFISAASGAAVRIRAGANDTSSAIDVRYVADGGDGIVLNPEQADRSTRIQSVGNAYQFYLDASTNRVGIGTNTPGFDLDVTGSGRFVHADGKCGLVVQDTLGSGLHIGDCALGTVPAYAGMKHSNHGDSDYMIISNGVTTFLSAVNNGAVIIRGGGNDSANEIQIKDVGAGVAGIIFNEGGADRDIRMEGDTEENLFYVDASTNRIGIKSAVPTHSLSVSGTLNASEIFVSGAPAIKSSASSALASGDLNVSGVNNMVVTDLAGYSGIAVPDSNTVYFII